MKKRKSIIAVLLSFVSAFTMCFPANLLAEETTVNADAAAQIVADEVSDAKWFGKEADPVHEAMDVDTYKDSDIVTAIVEMEEPPVLSYYDQETYSFSADEETTAGESVSAFLQSDEAQELSGELKDGQNGVVSEIKKLGTKAAQKKRAASLMSKEAAQAEAETEVVAQWTYAANAMAVKVPYGRLNEIRALDGVKRAYVQHVYDLPEEQSVDLSNPNYSYSLDMVGVEEAWQDGYTGKGMLVAVLDTGIDVIQDRSNGEYLTSHEAFSDTSFKSGDPESEDAGWDLRYDEAEMTKLLEDTNLWANTGADGGHITYDNNALYKNRKVPFGYDYADMDVHARPSASSSDHGVHVSGTIAGYAESEEGEVTFSGVAPDAQILAMKIFSDEGGGAEEVSIVTALEDSLALGADIINLSLGSDNGFAHDDTMQNDVYAEVERAGIVLMTSAGNSSYSSANNNYGGENTVDNPDTSMMSSPAVYDSNLSVASIENMVNAVSYLYYTIDGVQYEAHFTDEGGMMAAKFSDKEYPVYAVGGVGTYDDYYNAGFNNGWNGGKDGIALVQRGEISFVDKINNASSFTGTNYVGERYGVQAVIIYDNDPESDELINMSTDGTSLPSCFISGKSGKAITDALNAGKSVTIRTAADKKLVESAEGGQMSSFSSWGAGAALELKPEITAPGGNIWSALVNMASPADSSYVGKYGMMSGTSMAAPHMSGIGALVRQRVSTSGEFNLGQLSDAGAVADIVSQLLVSTAIPQKDAKGVYYSPRQQGAGLVNAAAALETPVYISVAGKNVGKLELGDDVEKNATYDISFDLHNISKTNAQYQAQVVLMRPSTAAMDTPWGERNMVADTDTIIGTCDLGTVTAKANSVTSVSKQISLDENDKKELDEMFPNGTFVEGYVILTSVSGDQPQLGLPLLSYYGDWTKAPIFDSATWLDTAKDAEGNESYLNSETSWNVSIIGSQMIADGEVLGYYNLGQNIFDPTSGDEQMVYHKGNIALSPDGDGYMDAIDDVVLYQLRDAKAVVLEARDAETGELYYHDWMSYVPRTVWSADYGFAVPGSLYFAPSWSGTDLKGKTLPNGTKCIYTITAFGDGDYSGAGTVVDDYYMKPVTDFSKIIPGEFEPTFNGHAMDKTGDVISFPVTIDLEAPKLDNNAVTVYTDEEGHTHIKGSVKDVDGSLASVEIEPIVKRTYKEGYGDPTYGEYGGDSQNPFYSEMIYDEGKKTLDFDVDVSSYEHVNESYPGENNYYDFTWEGNIYIHCGDYATNDRTYAIKVDATKGIVLSQTSALMYPGSTFELSVNNNTGSDAPITRTSSNPEVATIDEYGMIKAIAPGQTTITVSNGTDSAVCIVAVRERPTEVLDFNLSIDQFEGLKPDGQATVHVVDLYPADVEIENISWSVEEDDEYAEEWAAGLITVIKNSEDSLSGSLCLNGTGIEGEKIPGGHGVLTVTINGVSRKMDINWDDLYSEANEDDMLSNALYQEQVEYVNLGESVDLSAKYRQSSAHSVSDVVTELTGLKMDGPDFFHVNGSYATKLVNEEGYRLPEDIHVYTRYEDGYCFEMTRNGYYNSYTYDSTTGEIYIQYAPTGATNQILIKADGVAAEGNPAGTMSGTTYTRPDGLYGPFDWTLTQGTGEMVETELSNYYETYMGVKYTPSEPGVSYITAASKDGKYDLKFAVVCLPIKADTLSVDKNKLEIERTQTDSVQVTLSPTPTLEKDQELIWKSFNEDVATVDEAGNITGVSEGYAYVLVSSKANTKLTGYVLVHVLPKTPELTFNDEQGNQIAVVRANADGSVTPPAAPAKEGYTFAGWADADGKVLTADENGNLTGVTADMTVTAKYEINKYKVTFKADGKVVKEIEKEYKAVLTEADYPAVPEKDGYTGTWEKYTDAITADITVEAKYEAVPTPTPSAVPTETPSAEPTETPSAEPTETPSAEPQTALYGDVDVKGEVTAEDALMILQHVVQLKKIGEEGSLPMILADVNHDGSITASDALGALQVVVKLREAEVYYYQK